MLFGFVYFALIFIGLDVTAETSKDEQCGIRTSVNQYPWLVGIEYESDRTVCTGVLISKSHVVSKAECFGNGKFFLAKRVRLGPFNTSVVNCTEDGSNNTYTDGGVLRVPIKMVLKHSIYLPIFTPFILHDIALVTLSEMVPYTDFIRPICLPSVDVPLSTEADRSLYVAGVSQNHLYKECTQKHETATTYVNKEKCDDVRSSSLWLADDICVTDEKNVSSPLARGALLMNKRGESYELVGLSEAIENGTNNRIFTNIFPYLDWLQSKQQEWKLQEWKNALKEIAAAESKVDVCGKRKIEDVELITSGDAARPNDWPWHAAIYKREKASLKYTCGGTLISKTMVLTAAHCATENGEPIIAKILTIVLGKHNLIGEDSESQEREVDKVILHEDFAPMNPLENDIALLKLKTEATYSNYVRSACWSSEAYQRLRGDQVMGTVIGWGIEKSDGLSIQLKQQKMQIVSELTCLKKNSTICSNVVDNNKKFCAGWSNDTTSCNGDSGGGFLVFVPDSETTDGNSGSWYIRGIKNSPSSSIINETQCSPDKYLMFTDVAKYTEWIQKHLADVSQPLSN